MSGWSIRVWRDRRGIAATEFALLLPFLLLLLVGIYEFGSYLAQASSLEKSLRSGAMFAARSALPLSSQQLTQIGNIVRTGDPSGQQPARISGWSDGSATLTVTTRAHSVGSESVELIRLEASVPYEPLMEGFLSSLGFSDLRMRAAHEQAHVGS
jgi:Flp pilus assembly protein TadG